jgi:hypothetical protein
MTKLTDVPIEVSDGSRIMNAFATRPLIRPKVIETANGHSTAASVFFEASSPALSDEVPCLDSRPISLATELLGSSPRSPLSEDFAEPPDQSGSTRNAGSIYASTYSADANPARTHDLGTRHTNDKSMLQRNFQQERGNIALSSLSGTADSRPRHDDNPEFRPAQSPDTPSMPVKTKGHMSRATGINFIPASNATTSPTIRTYGT